MYSKAQWGRFISSTHRSTITVKKCKMVSSTRGEGKSGSVICGESPGARSEGHCVLYGTLALPYFPHHPARHYEDLASLATPTRFHSRAIVGPNTRLGTLNGKIHKPQTSSVAGSSKTYKHSGQECVAPRRRRWNI